MSDPARLLDSATDAEARLLRAGLDEPPPSDLLERTLGAVAVAGQAVAAASAGAAATKATATAAGAHTAGGGILSAIAIGTIAGLLTVGAYEVATRAPAPPPPPRAVPAIVPAAPSAAPLAPAPAPPSAAPSSALPARSAAPPLAAPTPASAPSSTLATELALLDDARSALRAGDRVRARALLDRYAREIPRGQLAREAAMLRAEIDASAGAMHGP